MILVFVVEAASCSASIIRRAAKKELWMISVNEELSSPSTLEKSDDWKAFCTTRVEMYTA